MRVHKYFIFSMLLVCSSITWGQLKLPLTFATGYGPFKVDKSSINFDSVPKANPLYKSVTSLQYNNVPSSLQSVKKGIVWFNFSQFLYQNLQSGNVSKEVYEQFRKQWGISTPEKDLSKLPINCYVLVIKGINKQGEEILLVDTDNDKDFTNELPITVPEYKSDKDFEELVNKAIQINYQAIFNNKVISRKIPLIFLKDKYRLFYSIPQYAVAKLKIKNAVHEIAVSHEFRFPDYSVANIALLSKQKIATDSVVHKNQLFHIGNLLFKNTGVNYATLNLQLEEVKDSISGTQKGMQAIPFKGLDVVSGKKISLDDFKGKYLFIDFWGTWCSPCVAQLPKLKEIYSTIDKSKIAFLGIAGNDEMDRLKNMLTEKKILWPNVLSDEVNTIVEKYTILSYPTGILLSPEGKIIETNMSAVNLEVVLKKYL